MFGMPGPVGSKQAERTLTAMLAFNSAVCAGLAVAAVAYAALSII